MKTSKILKFQAKFSIFTSFRGRNEELKCQTSNNGSVPKIYSASFFVKRGREQTATAIAAASATTVDYVIANLPVGPVQAGLKLESLGHSGWDDV